MPGSKRPLWKHLRQWIRSREKGIDQHTNSAKEHTIVAPWNLKVQKDSDTIADLYINHFDELKSPRINDGSAQQQPNDIDPRIFEHRLLNHQIWRTLHRGNDSLDPMQRRPPLPTEIVRMIVQLARISMNDSYVSNKSVKVDGRVPFESQLLIHTPPLDASTIASLRTIQVFTRSKEEGSLDNVLNYSTWFEWGIFPSVEAARERNKTYEEDSKWWMSHSNKVGRGVAQVVQGRLISEVDYVWRDIGLREGCVIAVRACATVPASNCVQRVEIRMWKGFEPVIPM
ncbi:hypothetical protein BC629DRAFT_1592436 [Irpex lacteus]|nr:hypothetical protein BC629DRAFT_1592436 [Irpex lacteus]